MSSLKTLPQIFGRCEKIVGTLILVDNIFKRALEYVLHKPSSIGKLEELPIPEDVWASSVFGSSTVIPLDVWSLTERQYKNNGK